MVRDGDLMSTVHGMTIRLLGPVWLGTDQIEKPLPPKVRKVLAVLALRAGSVVASDTLIAELWADSPPRSAMATMQTYIYQLRTAIRDLHPGDVVVTASPGYVLRDESINIDLAQFRALAEQAKADYAESPELTISIAHRALELVEGEPLLNVQLGQVLNGSAIRLREEITALRQLVIEAQVKLCRYHEAALELQELCLRHPFREQYHYQLMEVLSRIGRRAEALEIFAELSRRLRSELGIDPPQSFQRLHMEILNGIESESRGICSQHCDCFSTPIDYSPGNPSDLRSRGLSIDNRAAPPQLS